MSKRYHFGRTLTRRFDYFAYPRTGSHFFRHCTAGLFDLVTLPGSAIDDPEAVSRADELDPEMLYALNLREDGVAYAPVHFDAAPRGQHAEPAMGEHPVIVLVRHPLAAIYSQHRVLRDRRSQAVSDTRRFLQGHLRKFAAFYEAGLAVRREHPDRTLWVHYEDLLASPEPLERLVRFVGAGPKLRAAFVHRVTRFDTITRPGERTFYREGDNDAWRRDEAWVEAVASVEIPDFGPIGYPDAAGRSGPGVGGGVGDDG
jgi:hypothetical protein